MRKNWTDDEDSALLRLHARGYDWREISEMLPGRSPSTLLERWCALTGTLAVTQAPVEKPKPLSISNQSDREVVDRFVATDGSERLHLATVALFRRTAKRLRITVQEAALAAHHGSEAARRFVERAA